jgi:hypothetical protein
MAASHRSARKPAASIRAVASSADSGSSTACAAGDSPTIERIQAACLASTETIVAVGARTRARADA